MFVSLEEGFGPAEAAEGGEEELGTAGQAPQNGDISGSGADGLTSTLHGPGPDRSPRQGCDLQAPGRVQPLGISLWKGFRSKRIGRKVGGEGEGGA